MGEKKMEAKRSIWDDFTNQYSLSKTLRFELKPIGSDFKFLESNDKVHPMIKKTIEDDEKREKDFNRAKKILDDYYRHFIEEVLSDVTIDFPLLKKYVYLYTKIKEDNQDDSVKKDLADLQAKLRKELYTQIKKRPEFLLFFEKQKIRGFLKIVSKWLEQENRVNDMQLIDRFNKWATYFVGFINNRKNVFSVDEIPTSIIYRIIHDNLPRFIDSLMRFEEIKKLEGFDYSEVEKNFKKELGGRDLSSFFSLESFNSFLTQSGINLFNLVVGGKTEKDNHLKGLNQLIKEFSDKKEDKKEQKMIRRLKLIPLYKQILSDRDSFSFVLEKIGNDEELIRRIKEFYHPLPKSFFVQLKRLLSSLKDKDLDHVYLNNKFLTDISQELFSDWEIINLALKRYAEIELKIKASKLEDWFKKQKYVSINSIEKGLHLLKDSDYPDLNIKGNPICAYLSRFEKSGTNLFNTIEENYSVFKNIDVSNTKELSTKSTKERESDVEKIKAFLDSLMDLFHFIKPLKVILRKKDKEKTQDVYEIDTDFYGDFDRAYENLSQIVPLYNKVRNYITQKPFSTKKFKLNFQSSSFLNGWTSEFGTKSTLLFRKNNDKKTNYFLGIVEKKLSESEVEDLFNISDGQSIELIEYDFQKPDNKNIPRLFIRSKGDNFAPAVKKYNLPVQDIIDIYDNGYFKTEYKKVNELKFKESLTKLINYFKLGFKKHEAYKHYNFKWKESHLYENISDFYHDVEISCYQLSFRKINLKNLLRLVESGRLYLFQIWNKDFSEYSHGKKNLHTIYWEQLFSEDNLRDTVYKLNGEAEIFYRKKSIPLKVTHEKRKPINNKNPINNKQTSKFGYDLIKDKRYTEDKFLFHCPITLNFKAKSGKNIHKMIKKHIHDTEQEINIIGIDRGERHLVYYALLNSEGEILEQNSFNILSDDFRRKFNYLERLEKIEGKRDEARKNWKKISNIKEMKEGYLSHVIHKITKLAIENNAIIVLENLNFGFKRGRFKIEKQIYQKFERALIEKLNFLVFKDRSETEIGGPLKAYQLTNKFESFQKLSKQSGILFYVDARNTSKIDYRTGFVNLLWPKFENIKKSKEFFSKFEHIKFNSEEGMFEFRFKYSKFKRVDEKDKTKLAKDKWTIYSNGNRLVSFRNKEKNHNWDVKEVDLTKELKDLFSKQKIEYKPGHDLIGEITKQENAEFFKRLTELLRYTLQLRNSNKETGEDYILSCVKDKNGEFFDSRKAKDNEPKDADANGAYHIGIKGLIVLEKIRIHKDASNLKPKDLAVSRNEFINYLIKKRWM